MDTIAVIFWTGTGNTEAMANAVAEGVREAGAQTLLASVGDCSAEDVLACDKIALGCPAMGDEVLEESEFEPFFQQICPQLKGKTVALFGSYDWGDGQWMRDWMDRVKEAGAALLEEGLILNNAPDEDGLVQCRATGKALAAQ